MTTFKANRKFPNPITVTDDPKSHTIALQQIIEALSIGQRRTKEVQSSYVRVHELVDVGLIEVVGNQLKLTNAGAAAVAAGATALADLTDVNLTGLTDGDTLVWDAGTSKWIPGAAASGPITGADMYDVSLNDLADVAVYMPSDGDPLVYNASTGLWEAGDVTYSPVNDGAVIERTTDQSITGGAWTTVDFTTEVRDDNNYWSSGSSNRFTAPASGYYTFHAHANWDSTSTARGLFLFKGASRAMQIAGNYTATRSNARTDVSWVGYLSVGEFIELWAFSDSTSSITGSVQPTRMSIHRLGVAQSPSSPQNDGAIVRRAASAQSINEDTATAVTFDTEVRDDGGYANLTANNTRLTVTNSGWYLVSGTVIFDANTVGFRRAWFHVNGSTTHRYGYISLEPVQDTGNATSLSPSALLYLNAGDYVELIAYKYTNGAASTLTLSISGEAAPRFSIHRLGVPNTTATQPVDDGCYVRRTGTAQSISDITLTAIQWDTEVRDDNNYWTSTSNTRFTIPVAGWYSVGAAIDWSTNTTGNRYLILRLNGTTRITQDQRPPVNPGGSSSHTHTTNYYFNAGDYVEVLCYQNSGSTLTLATTDGFPRAWIHRLGASSSPGNPRNDGAFVYRAASAQTLTTGVHTAVTFDTELRDDGDYANLTANNDRLTVLRSGWYALAGNLRFTSNATGIRSGHFRINGNTAHRLGQQQVSAITTGADTCVAPSAVIYLNAGDYVQLYAWQDSGGDLTLNLNQTYQPSFSIHRLGVPETTTAPLVPKDQDSFPAIANSMDDEFEDTTLSSKWAWRNQGGATATLSKGYLHLKAPAGTTQNTRNIEQTISGSFKIQSKIAIHSANIAQYLNGGLSLWNNSSGKGMIFCFFVDTGNVYRLMICRMNSATSFGTAPYKADIWGGAPRLFLAPQYFEIEYDGTTMYFRYSDTGLDNTWFPIYSETTATFLGGAPDRVGLFANSENSYDVYLLCDWFRRIS